ncbi:gp58-like family protein, partial [Leuconostoc falkenbergense]|uniref:gp58-like family protein n=1 Tax=Leuconostoc falkenbergense TaxID=2766470 RepID=UPI0021A9EE87
MYISGITATNVSVSDPKLEMGNVATDHSLAPEDLSSATAKAQLTADQATTALNNYKTDADGRISKAQSDITQTANQVETKVSQTDYDKKTGDLTEAVSKVKITADGINNFVRDSSGNISFDFQTALSKTSIITGSTLATSIQTQTSSQISSAITDNNGKIISLINQDTSGVQIAGENIVLDGDTTVTGDFYAKGGNFKNLNASNLTVGTLNGSQVNITNINASNIVSGAISGANLNINLNTGSVVFQKGRIN